MARNKVEVVEFEPSYASALASFISQVWDPKATAESVLDSRRASAESNPSCSHGRIPTILFLLNGEVVGHIMATPERMSFSGGVRETHWMTGFHVLPRHRSGPVGFMVAKELARVAPGTLTFTVESAPLRIFRALGYRYLGVVPNYVKLLRPAVMLQRIDLHRLGMAGTRGWRARALAAARASRLDTVAATLLHLGINTWVRVVAPRAAAAEYVVHTEPWAGVEYGRYDRLWERVTRELAVSPVRDAARLKWRFTNRGSDYVMIEARERNDAVGYCILKRPRAKVDPRLGDVRIAAIADLLFPPERLDLGCGLLAAAEGVVAQHDIADALLASTPHAAIRRVVRRSGYLKVPGNLKLVVHPSVLPSSGGVRLENWWLARGDCSADETF